MFTASSGLVTNYFGSTLILEILFMATNNILECFFGFFKRLITNELNITVYMTEDGSNFVNDSLIHHEVLSIVRENVVSKV
ncbi:hypothetical protein HanRHA438_Chr10g0470521 [Helianthus annuus]|nr:hypothetical protein HanRHA438_Chr10g0470521 [Helianthus annuus]KAJ0885131.1 hypothetical protein HanPSC8_Chr10g0441851 [Helianthus annuus]